MLSEKLIEKIQKEIDSYSLEAEWDYGEVLDNNDIRKIMNGKADEVEERLLEDNIDYLSEMEHQAGISAVEEFRDEIIEELGIEESQFCAKDILDGIIDRLDINADLGFEELLKHTNVRVRLTLYSDYDCMNSAWLESQGGIEYDRYLKDAIDFLELNPARLKRAFLRHGYKTTGKWPDRKKREGREWIEYNDFIAEFGNTTSGANLLTVLGIINLLDIYKNQNPAKVFIPEAARVGFFDSFYGGGSVFEAMTKAGRWVKLGRLPRKTKYDLFRIVPDIVSYNTGDVYGWGDNNFVEIGIMA